MPPTDTAVFGTNRVTDDDTDAALRKRVNRAMERGLTPDRQRLARIEQGLVRGRARVSGRFVRWVGGAALAGAAAAAGAAFWAGASWLTPPTDQAGEEAAKDAGSPRTPGKTDTKGSGASETQGERSDDDRPDENQHNGDTSPGDDPVIYQR